MVMPHLPSSDGVGASDCEAIRDATLAQPVNALTSLAAWERGPYPGPYEGANRL